MPQTTFAYLSAWRHSVFWLRNTNTGLHFLAMSWWGSFYTDHCLDSSVLALIQLNQSKTVTTMFVCFLEHGLLITELSPYISEGYIRACFKGWGTPCVWWGPNSTSLYLCCLSHCLEVFHTPGLSTSTAYVGFCVEDEASWAEWAGPHYIGGDVNVRQVVTLSFSLMWQNISHSGFI